MKTKLRTDDPQKVFFGLDRSFTHMPGLNLGATDSAHQVFFGRYGDRVVAVKPFNNKNGKLPAEKAEHEMFMLKTIRGLGFLTLNPLRVKEDRAGTMAFLLTDYVPDLVSMSAIAQSRNPAVPEQLRRTAKTLAKLHSEGISHGDAQIKNFGLIPRERGKIAVIDPEKGGTNLIGHHKNDPFVHDVESLVQSLAHKAYGGRDTDQAGLRVLSDVIEPYITTAEALGVPNAIDIGERAFATHLDKHNELFNSRSS
ncbi:MAG: lipopolysaccharide kinase InaA family protein [bacterium]|nr:lipopolysaccharide kinase InaA family protein [bacterium]